MDVVARSLKEAECRLKDINDAISKGDSEIQKFYQDSVIFITGVSGFMGKLLVEKLLRACNVRKIYILIRPKEGKTIRDRLNDIKKDPGFDYLRETQPNFGDKIVSVEGDISEIRLGISDSDWGTLTEEVDTIFHLAATTNVDIPLPAATLINIRGTREILHLAKQCSKLRVFEYVSTAYCQATTDKIGVQLDEKFQPCPIPPATLIELVENVDKTRLGAIVSGLTKSWPNTYTFTKAVAEELVRSMADEIPICIVRPPIGTYAFTL
ncbi:hypothetical protein O3G_MSEX011916 [Manduca sexta]|uniref:Fatty acyl-CoA reductase n=1 Tax=Manduca sexta TaxID=7130 RepID=A0A921ZNC7_MANSE|nr:hypothetical protein O3G_MSEX011916 [Manduca sexta]